jgi:uncharacterized Zn-binding protein involved in type VI secretion
MFSILGSICIGDKTSCGGTVITGSPASIVNGKGVARQGDKIACPRRCIIVEGNQSEIVDGAAMALHGAMTTHGCICISKNNEFHGDTQSAADMAEVPVAADAGLAYMPDIAELLNEAHWVEIKLVNDQGEPIPDQPFELTDPSGEKFQGTLDVTGYAKVEPVKSGSCVVHFPQLGYTISVNS